MSERNNQPAWVNAFWDWHAKIVETLLASNVTYISTATRNFTSDIDWNMCHFCAGPCGNCPQKHSGDPYACDDCSREVIDYLTECDFCPYKQFRNSRT